MSDHKAQGTRANNMAGVKHGLAVAAIDFVRRHETEAWPLNEKDLQASLIVNNDLDARAADATCLAAGVYRQLLETTSRL